MADKVLEEIRSRLKFLYKVGLEYLTLDRLASTLSGGESQRIQLATALGSNLVGALYVLDEPSIGLHPRDTGRLIEILKTLRDLGNTVLVVEHDPEMMREADKILDLGPGAGEQGGRLVYEGDLAGPPGRPTLAHRPLPVRRPRDPLARGTPQTWKVLAAHSWRARTQPEIDRRGYSAGAHGVCERRFGFREIHTGA